LVIIKGQLIKVQYDNENLSKWVIEAEQVAKKVESLQIEYDEFN
jgi:hypothetical protein